MFLSVLNTGVDSMKPIWQEGMEIVAGLGDSEHLQVEENNVWFWQQVGTTPQNILVYYLNIAILYTAFSVLLIKSI